MINEHWTSIAESFELKQRVTIFVGSDGTLAQVPSELIEALEAGTLLNATLTPSPSNAQLIEVWRGGKCDARIPVSLLRELKSSLRRENPQGVSWSSQSQGK